MCKAQAIMDELVSIGQGNRKDSGSTKGMQVGNKMYDVLYLFGENLDPLLVVPSLLTEMVEEDSNGNT